MESRFNLLDEPWISVLVDETGEKTDVSMLELFRNAATYYSLAGEMETQNFAVMRFLLSVIQTVFSRFDEYGNVLPGIVLDERWRQTDPVEEDDLEDYGLAVDECWKKLYLNGFFPDVVLEYLEKWRDHFFLFDEKHPFYQVNKKEMDEIMKKIPKKNKPTSIFGKNLNRTISESENKQALFSPIAGTKGKRGRKDVQTAAELARWLIMFQGYSGLADKVSLTKGDQKPSKGWLFDLGGLFLQGSNVFETLLMNYIPESFAGDQDFSGRVQTPCWESDGGVVVNRLSKENYIDNIAELYTNWSRAIYIDPEIDLREPVEINVVKLPEIEHTGKSIEPMTLWRWNDNGPNKNSFTPKKHNSEESLWRSFGIITMKTSADGDRKQLQPGIFTQYQRLKESAGSRWTDLAGVSMKDDGNATSWLPVDEITDSFRVNDLVITDTTSDGWVIRISDVVETTKEVVSGIFKKYLRGIYPSKSAVIGMIAGGLGYNRDDDEKIVRLNSLDFAVRIDQVGQILRDYHTARKYKENGDFERTYVTNRYYLQDAVFVVALSTNDEELINDVKTAVTAPYYSLFLGRRSLPPTADFLLDILDTDPITALKEYPWQASAWYQKKHSNRLELFADMTLLGSGSIRIRNDEVVSFSQKRGRKFNPRREAKISLDAVVPDKKEEHDAFGAIGES